MELEVVKVEEGLCAGRVLFHAHRSKTQEEAQAQEGEIVERERLKSERRRQQVGAWCQTSGSLCWCRTCTSLICICGARCIRSIFLCKGCWHMLHAQYL